MELRDALMPTLERLYRTHPESLPFQLPVDPVMLQIPDYFDIVLRPMDLSTIRRKLEANQYADPWQYVDDVWLMFENAWLYNKRRSTMFRFCTKLSEVFEQAIDPVMQSLGYCCGRKYMDYRNRYAFCLKCFQSARGHFITIQDGEGPDAGSATIPKNEFVERKTAHSHVYPVVKCKECGRQCLWP